MKEFRTSEVIYEKKESKKDEKPTVKIHQIRKDTPKNVYGNRIYVTEDEEENK